MIGDISHIGIVVNNIEEAGELYSSIFQVPISETSDKGDSKVSILRLGKTLIELFEPLGEQGVIAKFLKTHGEGIHHVCFQVEDLDSQLEALKSNGVEVVGPPSDGIEGRIVFLHPKVTHGVLIELVQKR